MTEQEDQTQFTYSEAVKQLEELMKRTQRQLDFLRDNKEKILSCGVPISICNDKIDFDRADREHALTVIKTFSGDWEKDVDLGHLNYTLKVGDGLLLRLYNATPPPSCRIVETEVNIPEDQIQRTRTVRKVVCNEPEVA